jgi:hypothetical protein
MTNLDLDDIKTLAPLLPSHWAESRLEAAIYCLTHNGHKSGAELEANGRSGGHKLVWKKTIGAKVRNVWSDHQVATEIGAEGIAAVMAKQLTTFTILSRASKTTGIDYWLTNKEEETKPENELLLFQNKAARLEVSGLLAGSDAQYKARIKQKIKQTHRSISTGLPAYISVTDFGRPRTTFKKV